LTEPFGRKTERLASVLRAIVPRTSVSRRGAAELAEAWEAAAGPEAAARTNVSGYKNGTMTVEVEGSELLMELAGFGKTELIKKLAASGSRYTIRDLRFKLRPGPERGEP
jgi:hypothetical protein